MATKIPKAKFVPGEILRNLAVSEFEKSNIVLAYGL